MAAYEPCMGNDIVTVAQRMAVLAEQDKVTFVTTIYNGIELTIRPGDNYQKIVDYYYKKNLLAQN
jgi:hypothetical protein